MFPIFKQIIQTTNQVNTCHGNDGDDNTQWSKGDHGDENQKDKQTVCLKTAVNTGHGFSGIGSDLGSDGLSPRKSHTSLSDDLTEYRELFLILVEAF